MDNILDSIKSFREKNILVVGDLMLDRWTFGRISKLSPEAPVPVVEKTHQTLTLGGAANVAHNIAALGAHVGIAGVIGNDHNGSEILTLLINKKIPTDGIYIQKNRPTTEKHRIVSGENHQLLRLDLETTDNLSEEDEDKFYRNLYPLLEACDAVILSDYAKGVFSRGLAQRILAEAKRLEKITLADFKPRNKSFFYGADIISPNLEEGRRMTGFHDSREVGVQLVRDFNAYVVLTRGGDGISAFKTSDAEEFHVPGKRIKVFDVSGAGDTAVASLALGLASGLSVQSAVMLSNEASAIVVQKPGTATLTADELASAFKIDTHIENIDIVPKVWGYEKWIENNVKYCCKILSLNRGYQCSLHYHKEKDETFMVTQGHVRLELGDEVLHLRPGSFVRVPPGTHHRFTGMEDSLIMEVSTHHDEADSYRIEESRKAPEFEASKKD